MTEYDCVTCGETVDIVGVVMHDCDRILSAEALSSGERNTLLYVESRVVDRQAELDPDQMNFEDRQNLKLFHAAGILEVDEQAGERVKCREGMMHRDVVSKFTDRAWEIAAECRRMRGVKNLPDGEETEGSEA